jgi:hypothetical protein
MTMAKAFSMMLSSIYARDVSPLQLEGIRAWRDTCTGPAAQAARYHGWATKVTSVSSETHAAWVRAARLIIADLESQTARAEQRHAAAAIAAAQAAQVAAQAAAHAEQHARAAVAADAREPGSGAAHRQQARRFAAIADQARTEEAEHQQAASAALLWQSLAGDAARQGQRLIRDITGLYAGVATALDRAGGAAEVYDDKRTATRGIPAAVAGAAA